VPEHLRYVRCNSRGCSTPVLSESVRIVCVGGSTTWGDGVSDEETYPAQLERMLNSRPGGPGCAVINMGTPGTTSWWGLHEALAAAEDYEPAVAVIGYGGLNDSMRVHFREEDFGYDSPLRAFCRSFYLFRLVEHPVYRYLLYPAPVQRVDPEAYRKNLSGMVESFGNKGVQVVLLAEWLPDPRESGYGLSGSGLEALRMVQSDLARRYGVHRIDPKEVFSGKVETCFTGDRVHWSVEGCRAVAQACAAQTEASLASARAADGALSGAEGGRRALRVDSGVPAR